MAKRDGCMEDMRDDNEREKIVLKEWQRRKPGFSGNGLGHFRFNVELVLTQWAERSRKRTPCRIVGHLNLTQFFLQHSVTSSCKALCWPISCKRTNPTGLLCKVVIMLCTVMINSISALH